MKRGNIIAYCVYCGEPIYSDDDYTQIYEGKICVRCMDR